jgi:hypothetical protein
LLIVLATLVVAGVTLSMLATASLQRVLDAQTAQDDLQHRWGTIGLERTLLPRATEVLEQIDELRRSDDLPQESAGYVRDQIELGGVRFDLILADEEAKANLNSIYHEGQKPRVERTIRRLTEPAGQIAMRVMARTPSGATRRRQLRPADDESDADAASLPPAFLNWGDVFDLQRLRQTAGDDRILATLTDQITLWGSGRINVERASDEAVMAVCGTVLSDGLARRLLDRYRDQPETELELLIEKEIGSTDDAARLRRLVREDSSTFSLWMEVTSRRSRNQKCSIMQIDPQGQIKTFEIAL